MVLAAAARRDAPRDSRPLVAAAVNVNGFATRAGVARTAADLLAVDAADGGPESEPRAAVLRCAPRVADGADAGAADLTVDPGDSVDPVSARAAGAEAYNPPTPSATARAPTRPSYKTRLYADRCAFTNHHLLRRRATDFANSVSNELSN